MGSLLNFLSLHVVKHQENPSKVFDIETGACRTRTLKEARLKGAFGSGDPEEPHTPTVEKPQLLNSLTVPASKLPQYVEVKGVT